MGELGTLTMEQVRAMDNAALRLLVARLLWETEVIEPGDSITVAERDTVGRIMARRIETPDIPHYLIQSALAPDWITSLDDAITLLVGRRVELQSSGADWGARVGHWVGGDGWERAETPAHAVALAWVAWKLAQGG
jgi:hypothetical protein